MPTDPPTRLDDALDEERGAAPGVGVYDDPRAKDQVQDPGFARAVGLASAVLMQHGDRLSSDAGLALTWAVVELTDYSEIEAAEQVGYDLGDRDVLEVLEELRVQVAGLARESSDLATTLRYLRAEAYVRQAATTAAGPDTAEQE